MPRRTRNWRFLGRWLFRTVAVFALCCSFAGLPAVMAADGTWVRNSNYGNWWDTANWQGGIVAGTTDLLTANPDLVGIFASNLIMAQGAGQAIAENKVASKVALIGFDSDDKTLGYLDDGTIAGLVVQDPYRMGYDGVKTALAVSKGETVEKNIDTGANLVTKANSTDPKIAALIHPKLDCK